MKQRFLLFQEQRTGDTVSVNKLQHNSHAEKHLVDLTFERKDKIDEIM